MTEQNHKQLMEWACTCAEHVLPLINEPLDERLINSLLTARRWVNGTAAVGAAMKASVCAHAVAREFTDPISVAAARAVGHAVATAHMADHSLGAALYALKAVRYAGGSVDEERKLQNEQLPPEIRDIVLTARIEKERHFRL